MLDNTGVFGASSYASDSPDGYASAVNEVVKEKEEIELKKVKDKEDSEKAGEKAKVDQKIEAENLVKKQKEDAEKAKK